MTIPRKDLERARQLGINVSEVVREALKARLHDEQLGRQLAGYAAAFEEWDEAPWDHLAGEGLSAKGDG